MWDIIKDAVIDTATVFPFILLIYILIELLEHRTSLTQNRKILQGELAPLIGSATGIIPQCGFSAMAAKLYDKGFIRTGTLLSVFIATSDEALIIMLAKFSVAGWIMPLIFIKLLIAIGVGYLANILLPKEKLEEVSLMGDYRAHAEEEARTDKSDLHIYLLSPLLHALKVALYLFIVNLVLGFVMDAAKESIEAAMLMGGKYWQPLLTAMIGLIPNCASSVILTGAFTQGGILFGSFVGGLCANAGIGLVVLYKNAKKIKRNILITITLYLVGVVAGIAINGFMALCGI